MIEPIIQAKNLRVVYNEGKSNEYQALRNESLEIYPNEYIILFGPSGCGKSTLLYSLLGILAPSSGELLIKKENPYKYNVKQMTHFQQSTIGIIFQSFNLIPSISVLDNVTLPMIFANIPKSQRDKRGMQLLKRFGVDAQAYKLPTNLSGGQSQRVAVARSLVNDPEILLADEPVGNLDSISAGQVMDTLQEINMKDKKTVILVTHDAKLLPYAHRVYYMKDGGVERDVANPEKKQIKQVDPGTAILSETEKLARLYPYDSPEELRVKSIVNFLTQDIGFDQVDRLDNFVKMFIAGRMTDRTFVDNLTRSMDDGGVELTRAKAELFATKINTLLKEAREIRTYRDNFRARVLSPEQDARIAGIRDDLAQECGISLSPEQQEALGNLVKFRIRGFIQQEDFRRRLVLPLDENGVGIDFDASRAVSQYLEKLLAQGINL